MHDIRRLVTDANSVEVESIPLCQITRHKVKGIMKVYTTHNAEKLRPTAETFVATMDKLRDNKQRWLVPMTGEELTAIMEVKGAREIIAQLIPESARAANPELMRLFFEEAKSA